MYYYLFLNIKKLNIRTFKYRLQFSLYLNTAEINAYSNNQHLTK